MIISHPPALRRLLIVFVLTLLGGMLRFKSFGQIGLSHFDEGIYALAGAWSVTRGGISSLDPGLIPYAPPGFPILVGLSYAEFGVSDSAAIVVSILCGVATIPVAAWLGRRTFGEGAGEAAAALVALSFPHIAFSRKALTDVPLLLAWMVAIGLAERFLERPRFGRALALGLALGIAQNFKYNGWLAGVLVLLSALLGLILRREERSRLALARAFGWGALAVLVAGLVYLPWFRFVELHGGYAALLRHHRGYLGTPSSWWPNLNQQLAQVHVLSGGVDWCFRAFVVSVVAGALGRYEFRYVRMRGWRALALLGLMLLVGALVYGLHPNLAWWVGLGWVPWLIRDDRPAVRLLGVWWLVLSTMTPFYHPYARLWLPAQMASLLILAGGLARVMTFVWGADRVKGLRLEETRLRPSWPRVALALLCVALANQFATESMPRPFPRAWVLDPEPSLCRLVFNDLAAVRALDGSRVRLLARRPLAFYLLLQGRAQPRLESGWESAAVARPGDSLLVDMVLIQQEVHLGGDWQRMIRSWTLGMSFPVDLDPVTLLDSIPSAATRHWLDSIRRNEMNLLRPKTTTDDPNRG